MEVWKDIAGYEGLYQVSNLGRVKGLDRVVVNNKYGGNRLIKEAVIQATDTGNGYKIVGLRNEGKRKNFYVHRLVAAAFVPNPNQLTYINHIDYDRGNNTASNLEWVTQKDNVRYSSDRMKKPRAVTRSATGHKYIYLRGGRYRVCLPHQSERSFTNLPDALAYKGVVLDGR